MTEGGFYQQKRTNPQAVAIVVLLHGAALTALLTIKGDLVRRIVDRPTNVQFIPQPKIPPEKPKPQPPQPRQVPQTHIATPQPIVRTQPLGPLFPQAPINPLPPPLPGPIASTTIDLPPVPPQPPHKSQSARARADLSSYVHDTDYPDAALRNDEQGTTRFRLQVAADGHVTDCIVTGSSGSSALDAATCRLMKTRARFAPARDSNGNPTNDTVANAIHWVLPAG
ncbi:MAG TPA: energy transducer TonB [Allosphingosinicella sp.]|jgi:protein TonB|nr:energy transducer TonB [Allosphingosinicella sp.]